MITLIYHSVAVNACSTKELNLFLNSIRKKNIQLNITGVLFYHRGNILQIIEGEHDTINALFKRIEIDSRHTNVVKLADFKIAERSYRDWSMVFKQLPEKHCGKVKWYLNNESEKIGLPEHSEKSVYLKVLIDSFINENET